MADTKISALTELAGADAAFDDDILPVVDTSATTTKKMTFREFALALGLPPGLVMPYAGSSEPSGWLLCYGQAVSRTDYADLFTAISTTYGTGDGSTTFNVPDLRGRVVAGQDDMGGTSANRLTGVTGSVNGDTLGGTGGEETHTLITAEMPAHTHGGETLNANGGTQGPATGSVDYGVMGSAGGDGAHNNVQPTIILNVILKV